MTKWATVKVVEDAPKIAFIYSLKVPYTTYNNIEEVKHLQNKFSNG